MPRASPLVDAYLAALPLVEVAIVGAGKCCRIVTEIQPGEPVAQRYYLKPSHAEMLLLAIGTEGLSGAPAAALDDAIQKAAAMLGAPIKTLPELRTQAEQAVAEVTERVKLANYDGKLKTWNQRFRAYRLAQGAKGEKAIGYWQFLEQAVTLPMVRDVAASGRAI